MPMMTRRKVAVAGLILSVQLIALSAWSPNSPPELPRRSMLSASISAPAALLSLIWAPGAALAQDNVDSTESKPFVSGGFPKSEYTNSIVASRDTNISPLEVYDTLRTRLSRNAKVQNARALDVGAGAGVSTQVFYQQLGFQTIDAVDWSGDAWQLNVVENGHCPSSVHFYEMDDERFLMEWKKQGLPKYDIIAFNFAVNKDKAAYFCKNLLKPDGLLLAPINTQSDYWLKQTYQLLDAEGNASWSASDVGAWSVQFQPDVTADTCQGIWCAPYNGFQKLRIYN